MEPKTPEYSPGEEVLGELGHLDATHMSDLGDVVVPIARSTAPATGTIPGNRQRLALHNLFLYSWLERR
jgi:hypothetical protein